MKNKLRTSGYFLILIFIFCSCNQDLKNFDRAKNSNSITELKSFITNYPSSIFVDSAEILIENLFWQKTLLEHKAVGYEDYLSNYPDGKFADSAKFYIETPFIINGILVDNEEKPLKGKSMTVYIANKETTVNTHKDEEQKAGIGKQIKGTGTLAMMVKGVEKGGALKLIDGGIVNPRAKTDEDGNFKFNLNANFVAGESELLIAVDYYSDFIAEGYPLVDKEGNPLILIIDKLTRVKDLGKVRTLKE